jgi:hypothetical protein
VNHADRTLRFAAIRRRLNDVEGPLGLDALIAAVGKKSALQADPTPRPPGPNHGSTSYADPTPAAAVDPTRGVKIVAEADEALDQVLELLDRVANACGREHRRVTPSLLAPEQPKRRWCESCARVQGSAGRPLEVLIDVERYSRYCVDCGRWKAEHGHVPPPGMVEAKQLRGCRWTTKIVNDAYRSAGLTPPEMATVTA